MKTRNRQRGEAGRDQESKQINRRTFVKLLPAAGAVGVAAPDFLLASGEPKQQHQPQPTQGVTKEMLHAAEQLIGIELNDAQETMALRGVQHFFGDPLSRLRLL